jgi:hypothetical protein
MGQVLVGSPSAGRWQHAGRTQQLNTASLQAQPDGTHASRGDPAAQYSIMQGKGACEQFIS